MGFSEWEEYKLGDIANVQTGPFGSQLHVSDYLDSGIPVVMPVNIGDEKIIPNGIMRVSVQKASTLFRYKLLTGDIIFSRRGDVERHAFVHAENDGWLCGTGCLKITVKENHCSRFISYQLLLPEKKKWLSNHAVGTTMPNLNTSILSAINIGLPNYFTQQRIASILSSLDDKIELNRQTNQTLEAIAQTLFKEMCVPKGDVLPEGWRVGNIGQICKNIRESTNPKDLEFEIAYLGLEHIQRKNLSIPDWGKSGDISSQKFNFQRGDILFGKLRPYFHKVGLAPVKGICSTDILVIRSLKDSFQSYVINHLYDARLIDFVSAIANGTRMPRVDWKSISNYPISIPPKDLLAEFNKATNDLYEKILSNVIENQTLTTLRDSLLPKLMKGEIIV